MPVERRAEELKNGAIEGTEVAQRVSMAGRATTAVAAAGMPEAEAVQPRRAGGDRPVTPFREPSEREQCTRT